MERLARFIRRVRYGRPVIVVSGLPRSGTSLMMQMLQAGGLGILSDALRAPDVSNPRGYLELEAVKDLERSAAPAWLAEARGKAVKVVSPLLPWLPDSYNYRVILMRRNLDEVIASQNRMLAERGEAADAAQDQRVKQGFGTLDDRTMRLLRTRRCFSTLVIHYADAVANPEETARRVDRFVGGGLDVPRMVRAVDPALYRNRRRDASAAG